MPKARGHEQKGKKVPYDAIYKLVPLSYEHHVGRSEISAYIREEKIWHVVATVEDSLYVSARKLVQFMVRTVNDYGDQQELIEEMKIALELCLKCEGPLTWEAEQEARVILGRAKLSQKF